MLTNSDLRAIKQLLMPLENKIQGVDDKLTRHMKTSGKEHNRLQKSINRIVDDLGEDVWTLKGKVKRVETHLGFAMP